MADAIDAAVVTADQFPQEALEELRTSPTHLARAHRHSDDSVAFQKEPGSALGHLKRVCLDALKILVMATTQKTDLAIEALAEDLKSPNDVYQRVAALRKRRKELSVPDGRETTLGIVEEAKVLFNEYE